MGTSPEQSKLIGSAIDGFFVGADNSVQLGFSAKFSQPENVIIQDFAELEPEAQLVQEALALILSQLKRNRVINNTSQLPVLTGIQLFEPSLGRYVFTSHTDEASVKEPQTKDQSDPFLLEFADVKGHYCTIEVPKSHIKAVRTVLNKLGLKEKSKPYELEQDDQATKQQSVGRRF